MSEIILIHCIFHVYASIHMRSVTVLCNHLFFTIWDWFHLRQFVKNMPTVKVHEITKDEVYPDQWGMIFKIIWIMIQERLYCIPDLSCVRSFDVKELYKTKRDYSLSMRYVWVIFNEWIVSDKPKPKSLFCKTQDCSFCVVQYIQEYSSYISS